MRGVLASVAAMLLVGAPAHAHDIGVSRALLSAQPGDRYALSVEASPGAGHLFQPPLLPARCRAAGNPRGAQGGGSLRFEFTCKTALTGADTLELPWLRDGIMLSARWRDGSQARRLFNSEAGVIRVPLSELQAGSGSWRAGAKRYAVLGIEHILMGVDHLLFVLALLLIVRGPWMLVKTITAFTLAHSFTLGLATLGVIEVPPGPVEAAIALSIVFLCAEIVHAQGGRTGITYRVPWVVAFAFGLLHGLGFAGALAEIGLPQSEIPLALLFFNVGVEIGQLLFIAALLVPFALFHRQQVSAVPAFRIAPAYVIGTLAAYWLIERVAAMLPGA